MTINPLDLLNEQVTPEVVNSQQLGIDVDKKVSLLTQFYPILLATFHRFPERIETVIHLDNNALEQVFMKDTSAINELVDGFVKHHSLPESTIKALFNQALPLSAQALQAYSGQGKIAAYLHRHLSLIANTFPAWAAGVLASLGLGGILAANHTSQHVYTEERKAGGIWRWLAALIAFLILAFLVMFFMKSCQHKDDMATNTVVTEQTQATVVATTPAQIALTSGTGQQVQACRASLGNESLASQFRTAFSQVFGMQEKCQIMVDQAYATTLPAQDKLQDIFTSVKTVPNASLEWKGNQIILNAPDQTALATLVKQVKALAPDLEVITAAPLDVEKSVGKSVDDSKHALAGLNESARPEDIARALNIQIINFQSGSKTIPQVNKDVLDEAAELIKKVPNVQLDVEGYTDSTGNPELNKNLSQRRAQSVVDYLVSKGVERQKLKAVGYGQENPIADNATDQGKFRNRRIEFKVINTQSGKTSVVDEQHAQTSTAEQASH